MQQATEDDLNANSLPGISDSEFNMWRAVFAFALVDRVLSMEEQTLLRSYKSQIPFSARQLEILARDFSQPQNVVTLYKKISDNDDKKKFCVFARAIAWSEGKIDEQEREILKRAACFSEPAEREILESTRNHIFVDEYYQQYAKAGVVGLPDTPHILEMRI